MTDQLIAQARNILEGQIVRHPFLLEYNCLLTHPKDFQGQKKAELFTSFSLAGFGVSSPFRKLTLLLVDDAENLCIARCVTGRLHPARHLCNALAGITGDLHHLCRCGTTVAVLQQRSRTVAARSQRFDTNGDSGGWEEDQLGVLRS